MANNTRGNGGLVEYHNYVSASLGAPLPRAVGSLFPGASSYRAVPRGDESYPLPPPGFLHTSELSLGCKLGWSNDKKRAAFPHSFDPSPRSSLDYHNDTTTSDAVSEHDAATSLVDWMLSDASMSSCRDEFAFKQQLAQRLETGGCVLCVCVCVFIHSFIHSFVRLVCAWRWASRVVCVYVWGGLAAAHTHRAPPLSLYLSLTARPHPPLPLPLAWCASQSRALRWAPTRRRRSRWWRSKSAAILLPRARVGAAGRASSRRCRASSVAPSPPRMQEAPLRFEGPIHATSCSACWRSQWASIASCESHQQQQQLAFKRRYAAEPARR